MKVIKMVNRNFNDGRGRAREFLIDCRFCWYRVKKKQRLWCHNGHKDVFALQFWKRFGLAFWFSKNFSFLVTILACEQVVVMIKYICVIR